MGNFLKKLTSNEVKGGGKMTCNKIREKISLYIDGELTETERKEFEEHIKQCSQCRMEYKKILTTINLCNGLPQVEPPEDFHEKLLKKITDKNNNKKRSVFIPKIPIKIVAGMAAVFIIAFLLGTSIDSFFDSFKMDSAPVKNTEMLQFESDGDTGSEKYSLSGVPQAEKENYLKSEPQRNLELHEKTKEPVEFQQKIIKRANIEIDVEEFDKTYYEIIHLTEQAGGFIENSRVWKTGAVDSQIRKGRFTLRVPEHSFTPTIETLEALGEVKAKELTGSNITREYFDTEARVRNLEKQEQRLLEILDKAKTVDEILKVENELSRVRYQIESLTGQLKNWDSLVSYSTIGLQINEIKTSKKQIKSTDFSGIWQKAVQGFISTINKMLEFLSSMLVFMITYSPIFVIVIVALIVIRAAFKHYYKK
ncbi:MAG: hypothetical protein PWQ82_251 [Thermosediminibacterales bacterium]|nr:hypothetical protein [Thermosediminibacterales bacterium]MDK2835273.1 hypothetical protein [Thermosediminibacterales bacterium]